MKQDKPNMVQIYKEFHGQMDKPGYRPLIRCASMVFDAPVVFTDDKYELVSLYPAKKMGDFVYDTLLETGGLPQETIAAFHTAYLREPGRRYKPFYKNDGLVKDCPRIFAEVYDEVKVLGHVAVFLKDKEFEPWQLEVASALTDVLRIKINLTNQIPTVHSDLIQYLLNRNTAKQAKTRVIDQLSKFQLTDSLLLVAPLDQTKSQHAFVSLAINYLLHKYPNAIPTIYNDDLVILLTRTVYHPDPRVEGEKISEYLKQYQILCGAVYPIKSMEHLPDHYLQGRLTAELRYQEASGGVEVGTKRKTKEKSSNLLYYSEQHADPFLLYLSKRKDSYCFLHPALEKIKAYDLENHTDYLDTITGYCKNLFRKNETSEALHIHRNTLNYRLSRMEELFFLDLQDDGTLLHLLISLEFKRFTKS